MNTYKPTKFFLYARKSSESEDQQVQSIDDQIRVMKKIADANGYTIIDTFYESKSAKAPWKRVEFYKMIERIENKEAEWILAWKLDRLTRNPVDAWTIQYMLQQNLMHVIHTNDRIYKHVDSWLMFSVESGMGNQYILDLVKNVRRWLDSKYRKGIRPSRVPLWYINDKENRTIIDDEERFMLIRKLWDMMLSGNYNPSKILDIANNELWIRQRNGNKITRSGIYFLFNNIFYTGHFKFEWSIKKWIHTPMISLEEYDRVQMLLWKRGTTRPKSKEFSYTGLIECWACGAMVTAESKTKFIKSTNEIREYTYYHCTGRKKGCSCKQKSIRLEALEEQIIRILSEIEIIPQFNEWIKEVLKENHAEKVEQKVKQYRSINTTLEYEERKLKRLVDLLVDNLITQDEYQERKISLQDWIAKLKEQRDNIDLKGQKDLDVTEKIFDFATNVVEIFKNWDLQKKKEIFSSLGNNFYLKDWFLNLELAPWFQVIQEKLPEVKREYRRLELTKKATSYRITNDFSSKCSKWWVI